MISFFEKTKASISIFLILVLFPMYTCLYLAIDSARYSAAKAKVSGAMELTGNAALADYDKTFKELYGLFVMSSSEKELETSLVNYYSNMIDSTDLSLGNTTLTRKIISNAVGSVFENTVKTSTVDLSTKYETSSAIYNPAILQSYMRNYMKYRAPLNWVNGFGKKLESFTDLSKLSKIKDTVETEETDSSTVETNVDDTSSETAKSEVEALKEIANTDTSSAISNVSNLDIPNQVSEAILKTISLETVDSNINIDGLSLLEKAADNAYEMEYIATMFSCLTNQVSDGPAKFGEIEYIVFGKDNLTTNLLLAIDLIFAIRVIFNTAYVYTNASMRQSALALATSIAGFTGVGIPITQNAILIAWAMAESVLDVSSLCKGETVPIYKSSSTWTLSIGGISNTLAKGAENYASKAIDDVFSKIESASLERLDVIEDTALDYMEQTAIGVAENLTSTIITKVSQKITNLFSGSKTDYTKEEINAELLEAVNSIEGSSAGLATAKKLFITYCLPTLTDKIYENFGTDVTSAINEAYSTLFSKLKAEIKELMKDNEEKVSNILSKASGKVKEQTVEAIEEYQDELSKYLGDSDTSTSSISTGIGMTYLDYLRLFILIGLNSSSGKSNMLKRCAVIMQINCQKKDTSFNITGCYTGVSINTVTAVSNHKIKSSKIYEY